MTRPAQEQRWLVQELPDGTFALTDPKAGILVQTNQIGAGIAVMLDEGASPPEIAEHLASTFAGDALTYEKDVAVFVQQLAQLTAQNQS